MTKVVLGRYEMPAVLPDALKDLIARLLVTDPAGRIAIADVTRHPGFMHGLPGGYDVPVPFPLPAITGPIDSPVDPEFLEVLRSIGYTDEEVVCELLSHDPTRAKIFYRLYDSRLALCLSDGDADGQLWSRQETELIDPDGECLLERTQSQAPVLGFAVPLPQFMCEMQRQCTALACDWFHPSDVVMLVRRQDAGVLVRVTAVFTEARRFTVHTACLQRAGGACRGIVDAIVAHIVSLAAEQPPVK
jgi:hypothetical protein